MKQIPRPSELLQSGLIFSAISFLTGLGNMAFQAVIGRHLSEQGQYGNANSVISGFMPLLGLLPSVATFTVTHYIAHFNTAGDTARLQGLLLGCRKFLFWLTVGGSALAIVVIKPLSDFFHYNESLMLVTLACTLFGLWGTFVSALCQGLAWFKRLALIGFLAMALRFAFGWMVTLKSPTAENAVLASAFALLANLVLLFWRKDLSLHGEPVSPWNREFKKYLVVSAAYVAIALPTTMGPLLAVLFTSRSGTRTGNVVAEQIKLLGLYLGGLFFGAGSLFVLRRFCVELILGRHSPEAEAMIGQLSIAMVFVGLLQALALWSLASRWSKIIYLYGGLGIIYWLALFAGGKSSGTMLQIMPAGTAISFVILFCAWFSVMHRQNSEVQS